jgi:hypothetical protein
LWLKLRAASHGTASSLGKYIPGSKWSTPETLNQEWNEKLQKKPFEKTQTMEAHMSWGNEYEDLALLCFAEQYKLCVTQVGTIRVDFQDIHDNYTLYFPELPELVSNEIGCQENYHLLISPDGIVGKRDKKNLNYKKMMKISEAIWCGQKIWKTDNGIQLKIFLMCILFKCVSKL